MEVTKKSMFFYHFYPSQKITKKMSFSFRLSFFLQAFVYFSLNFSRLIFSTENGQHISLY